MADGSMSLLTNNRLTFTDSTTGLRFLIDTGASVSVIPYDSSLVNKWDSKVCAYTLYAANGSEIKTYGSKTIVLDLNLRHTYQWTFIIADVKQPILGADFIKYHRLLVDLSGHRLIDRQTNIGTIATVAKWNEPSLRTVNSNHPYEQLLFKYPDICKLINCKEVPKHSVMHFIEINGRPVSARSRPLPPDRYKKVKAEFTLMQEMGI